MIKARVAKHWPAVLAAIFMIGSAGPALACSCMIGDPEKLAFRASIIFEGTMIEQEHAVPRDCNEHTSPECRFEVVGVFSVKQTLKGALPALVRVRFTTYSHCGPVYHVGKTDFVAALGDEERGYRLQTCMFVPTSRAEDLDLVVKGAEQYRLRLQGLDDAIAARPSDPDPLLAKSRFLVETSAALSALDTLDRLLELQPLNREGVLLKAKLLDRRNQQDEALATLAPFLAANPDDHDARYQQAIALVKLDRVDEIAPDWKDFSELHGWRYDFSGRSLNKVSFKGSRIYGQSSFAGSQLIEADLSHSWMPSTDFSGANLSGALLIDSDLTVANLSGAILDGADLTKADLRRADLRGATLKGAKLSGALLAEAIYDDRTTWPDGFDPALAGAKKR